jgi:hypothetical protein
MFLIQPDQDSFDDCPGIFESSQATTSIHNLQSEVRAVWDWRSYRSIFERNQTALNEFDFRFRTVAGTEIIFHPRNRSVELRRYFLANDGFDPLSGGNSATKRIFVLSQSFTR